MSAAALEHAGIASGLAGAGLLVCVVLTTSLQPHGVRRRPRS